MTFGKRQTVEVVKKSVVAGVQRARERGAWVGRSVILGGGAVILCDTLNCRYMTLCVCQNPQDCIIYGANPTTNYGL